MSETVGKLREGRVEVILKVLSDTSAKVEGGDMYQRGTIVASPDMPWEDAFEMDSDGNTALSPFDLEIEYDSLTQYSQHSDQDLAEAMSMEDPRAAGTFLDVDYALDNPDAMSKAISQELSKPEATPQKDTGHRRRRGDHAA